MLAEACLSSGQYRAGFTGSIVEIHHIGGGTVRRQGVHTSPIQVIAITHNVLIPLALTWSQRPSGCRASLEVRQCALQESGYS